jgi:8-oxo-dGTP diphosphatase
MWSPPGGHLLKNETLLQCARREVHEETGLRIRNVRVTQFINDRNFTDDTHYLNVFLVAESAPGSPTNGEPEDFSAWNWFDIRALPKPLYFNIRNLLKHASLTDLRKCRRSALVESTTPRRKAPP